VRCEVRCEVSIMDALTMRKIAERLEAGEELAMVTVIASRGPGEVRPGTMMALDQYGQILGGSIGDARTTEKMRQEGEKCLLKGISRQVEVDCGAVGIEVFINAVCRRDRLIIVGSGSLILDLYQMARIIGYDITIIDNRSETLTRERFPDAGELLLGDVVEQLQGCKIDETTSIVIASHHHEWDQAALHAVIGSPARYIGILGNKRKVTAYFSQLNRLNLPESSLDRVHIPVGLDLGGQKSAEIALAVVAEMQAVKYGRPGGFLTIKNGTRGIEKRDELF